MINIFIALLSVAVGIYLGSVIFVAEEPGTFANQKKIDLLEEQLREAPMVISCVFNKPLTKLDLVEDVLHPQCYKFMCHFGVSDRLEIRMNKKYEDALDQLADAIMQWYNPEYNELLLIAHQEPNDVGGFVIDWTWKKPSHGVVDELGR